MNFREQRENFRNKKISAKEAVQEALGKVENDKLNIFISNLRDSAEKRAEEIDNNFEKYKDRPLSGVPIAPVSYTHLTLPTILLV